ncbi:MAG TPA: hypothetical protein VLR88_09525 [Propionibacteriaceae bacterium]|nr:hypothetical protein [Propionibacteriaceae bacterium]
MNPLAAKYLDDLDVALRGTVRPRDRVDAIDEVRQLLWLADAQGRLDEELAELGDARAFANNLLDELLTQSPWVGRFGPFPYDWRFPTAEHIRETIWDPSDPHVVRPRLFGVGWTLNFGAMATRLGWVRPDDEGEELDAAVPAWMNHATEIIPLALTAGTATLLASRVGRLPEQLPSHFTVTGRPDRYSPARRVMVGLAAATTLAPIIQVRAGSATNGSARLATRALATYLSGVTAAVSAGTLSSSRRAGLAVPLGMTLAAGAAFAQLVIPVVLARSRVNVVKVES